ncbi:MAG TPA: xanthine dehydrogenase family protein subunit M [Aciduliprofundum sp.]|nr:xanthine dehydrogenase family protein subunit M [Aciduliprofundum sp.]
MSFEVHRPGSLQEALEILEKYGEDVRPIAGGTDLVLAVRSGALKVGHIMDITRIPELRTLDLDGDTLIVGAAVTISELLELEVVRERLPALWEAMYWLGSPQIRNVATLVGNICNASPAADTAPPLMIYDARVRILGPGGKRVIPIEEFFVHVKKTVLEPGEMVGFVEIPIKEGFRSRFRKIGKRRAEVLSIVNAAVGFFFGNGRMEGVRIALGSVAPTPIRARTAEAVLEGKEPSMELVEEAASRAREETRPISDVRASAEYRREMTFVLVRRLILDLLGGVP